MEGIQDLKNRRHATHFWLATSKIAISLGISGVIITLIGLLLLVAPRFVTITLTDSQTTGLNLLGIGFAGAALGFAYNADDGLRKITKEEAYSFNEAKGKLTSFEESLVRIEGKLTGIDGNITELTNEVAKLGKKPDNGLGTEYP